MAAYINGYDNSMDVLNFGFTTQSAMFYRAQEAAHAVHEGVQCDGCNAFPLRGIRWHCKSCPDHDVCNNCKKQGLFPDHPFEIMSMTATSNQIALATGGEVKPENGVHWTTCRGCGANPIRNVLYACTVCPDFDLCHDCNTKRIQNVESHCHRFDFFVVPRPQNATPKNSGGSLQPRLSMAAPSQQHTYPSPAQSMYAQPQPQLQQKFHSQPLPQPSYTQYIPQQSFAPPPPPFYPPVQAKSGKVLNWLIKHLEME